MSPLDLIGYNHVGDFTRLASNGTISRHLVETAVRVSHRVFQPVVAGNEFTGF